jgi:nucleotide-binding universal stress UspA family protein
MQTWIVALDLQPSSHGAVRFASWVALGGDRPLDSLEEPIELVALHVIEREQLAPIFRLQSPEEVGRRAREALQRELDEAAIREIFAREEVGLGLRAHEVLEHHARRDGAAAIVIGRQLAKSGHVGVRLGTNARRLLRALPIPVIVVPELHATRGFGDGPVLVATDLGDDAVAAARFARTMARRIGREVVAVHAVPQLDPLLRAYLPEGSWRELVEQEHSRATAELRRWLEQHGLGGVGTEVVVGDIVEGLTAVAERTHAPLLVMGSRRLPTLTRAFVGSTAALLAAQLPLPVAVVPPD